MIFNLNQCVRVKLTEYGKSLHATQHALFVAQSGCKLPYAQRQEDADGWSTWKLWELMQLFGPHIERGLDICFDSDIDLQLMPSEANLRHFR